MPETARFNGFTGWIDLEYVEREATPEELMQLGIQLHLGVLSLSNTVTILDIVGVDRCHSTVHNWVQKAGLQSVDGCDPDHVALDETVIHLNDQRFWLYAAGDPVSSKILHVRLFPTRTQALTERFLADLQEKHDIEDTVFLVEPAPWLHAVLHRHGLRFQTETHGNRSSVEHIFKKRKRRTGQFEITSETPRLRPPKHGFRTSPTAGTS